MIKNQLEIISHLNEETTNIKEKYNALKMDKMHAFSSE